MADNFNLRSFLSENKLTKNAKLISEEQNLDEASFSDSYDTPAAIAAYRQLAGIVDIFNKGAQDEAQELDAAIAAAEQETGTQVTPAEKSTLHKQLRWIRTHSMEMEREGVENEEPVMEVQEEEAMEEVLTAKEQALVEMVQNALGIAPQAVAEEAPIAEEVPMAEDEMVQENPLPKYKNIDELMSNIEQGTNEAAHKYKMNRMKEVAEALEAKVGSLEEGENAEHIDQKVVKQMRKDILALRKAEEKLRKEFEKKFASKKGEDKKAEVNEGQQYNIKDLVAGRTDRNTGTNAIGDYKPGMKVTPNQMYDSMEGITQQMGTVTGVEGGKVQIKKLNGDEASFSPADLIIITGQA